MGSIASMVSILMVFPAHLTVSAIGGSETGGGVKVWTKPWPAVAGPVLLLSIHPE